MSHAHILTRRYGSSPAASTGRHNSVNPALTSDRARRPVGNDEFAAFARRVLRAYARRIATGDIDALEAMTDLSAEIDDAISSTWPIFAETSLMEWAVRLTTSASLLTTCSTCLCRRPP